MAKLGPKVAPIWLPGSQLVPRSRTKEAQLRLPDARCCLFSNQTTSTFWQISLDNPQKKLTHPKSCGVGRRHEASRIFSTSVNSGSINIIKDMWPRSSRSRSHALSRPLAFFQAAMAPCRNISAGALVTERAKREGLIKREKGPRRK